MSKHGIEITMRLPVKIVQKKKWYVASCPSLDVVSQGETAEEARENLKEALFLFLDSCIERGTLHQVLKDCGIEHIRPAAGIKHRHGRQKFIDVPLELLPSEGWCHNCLA